MEFAFLRAKKGQASIEFILLILLMLLYVQTIIQPSILISAESASGTMGLGETRFAGEKIANAINYIGTSGGLAKETIRVYVPKGAELFCKEDPPNMPAGLNCTDKICVGYYLKVPGNRDIMYVADCYPGNSNTGNIINPYEPDGEYQYCVIPFPLFGNIGQNQNLSCPTNPFASGGGLGGIVATCTVERTSSGNTELKCW